VKIEDFEGTRPVLMLERYFSGTTRGWGIMQSRFGALQRQFHIEAAGEWDEASRTLRLRETYRFVDGQIDRLDWTILKRDDRRYEGRETRIEDVAQGEQAGNAYRWQYSRSVPAKDGSESLLGFDDWFWLLDEQTLVARASVTKLGIEIASLSVFYRKE
jgi:hypothetical protein